MVAETADISFGDAWAEPYSSDGRGTNVVVVRSKQLAGMIDRPRLEGRLDLTPVDADFIVQTQAAGLRHRRGGLAYRLSWTRHALTSPKRVQASRALPLRRKLVYRLRYFNARWSHRIFRLARTVHSRWVYIVWARIALRIYQFVTWSRSPFGKFLDALLQQPEG